MITDGAGNTLMLVESLLGNHQDSSENPTVGRQVGTHAVLTGNSQKPGFSGVSDPSASQLRSFGEDAGKFQGNRGASWILGRSLFTGAITAMPPNPQFPDSTGSSSQQMGFYFARSAHAGGANGMTADGACRFFSDGMERSLFMAMGSRNGNEALDE